MVRAVHDERRPELQRQADPRHRPEWPGRVCCIQCQARLVCRGVPRCRTDVRPGADEQRQAVVAADSACHLTVAYTRNAADGKPHTLFVRTSADGLSWSDRSSVNDQGDSAFPAIASGPTAGDFRLAWQDNRNAECWDCGGLGGWNTWFSRSTDGGRTWSASVRLSSLGGGAPYKTARGYSFTDGDYFGLAVDSSGTNHLIWGEADGASLYCCGGAWYTRGG